MQYAAFGSLALGIGIALYILKKYGRLLNVMFLLAGAALAPTLKGWIGPVLNSVGGMLFGLALSTTLAGAALIWFIVEFKNKGSNKKTCWVAFLLPTLLVVSALPVFVKVTNMIDQVLQQGNQAVTQVK